MRYQPDKLQILLSELSLFQILIVSFSNTQLKVKIWMRLLWWGHPKFNTKPTTLSQELFVSLLECMLKEMVSTTPSTKKLSLLQLKFKDVITNQTLSPTQVRRHGKLQCWMIYQQDQIQTLILEVLPIPIHIVNGWGTQLLEQMHLLSASLEALSLIALILLSPKLWISTWLSMHKEMESTINFIDKLFHRLSNSKVAIMKKTLFQIRMKLLGRQLLKMSDQPDLLQILELVLSLIQTLTASFWDTQLRAQIWTKSL